MDDEVFRALADPSRRTLLDRLFERDGQTLGELEAALPEMTRFGVMKHLKVLEAASLVTSRKVGRERHHYLNPCRSAGSTIGGSTAIGSAPPTCSTTCGHAGDRPMTTDDATTAAPAAVPPDHVITTFIRATPEARVAGAHRERLHDPLLLPEHGRVRLGSRARAYRYAIEGETGDRGRDPRGGPAPRLVMTFTRRVGPGPRGRSAVHDDRGSSTWPAPASRS